MTADNSETLPKNSAALESAIPVTEGALPNNNGETEKEEEPTEESAEDGVVCSVTCAVAEEGLVACAFTGSCSAGFFSFRTEWELDGHHRGYVCGDFGEYHRICACDRPEGTSFPDTVPLSVSSSLLPDSDSVPPVSSSPSSEFSPVSALSSVSPHNDTTKVHISIEDVAHSGNFTIKTVQAKVAQNGSWTDITEDMYVEICTFVVSLCHPDGVEIVIFTFGFTYSHKL